MKPGLKAKKPEILLFDTYKSMIENSVGTKMFRNLYVKISNKKVDATDNGRLSCAFFVSSILYLSRLIKKPHGTVSSTIKDLLDSDWIKIKKPKVGGVIVWENIQWKDESHKHIGFCVAENEAVSTNWQKGVVTRHPLNNDKRKIEAIFWNKRLK
jgi:hypothetical protein